MELTGIVKQILPVKEGENFRKREFLVEYEDGTYTRTVIFQCIGGKMTLLDNIKTGDQVFVKFNVESRQSVTPDGSEKFWTNATCWFVKKI